MQKTAAVIQEKDIQVRSEANSECAQGCQFRRILGGLISCTLNGIYASSLEKTGKYYTEEIPTEYVEYQSITYRTEECIDAERLQKHISATRCDDEVVVD